MSDRRIGGMAVFRPSRKLSAESPSKTRLGNGLRIDAPASGKIVAMHFSLGDKVHTHNPLVELPAQGQSDSYTSIRHSGPRWSRSFLTSLPRSKMSDKRTLLQNKQ